MATSSPKPAPSEHPPASQPQLHAGGAIPSLGLPVPSLPIPSQILQRAGGAAAQRVLVSKFKQVVAQRFGAAVAVALAAVAADGPIPIGDLVAGGTAISTLWDIYHSWDDLWNEALQQTQAERQRVPNAPPTSARSAPPPSVSAPLSVGPPVVESSTVDDPIIINPIVTPPAQPVMPTAGDFTAIAQSFRDKFMGRYYTQDDIKAIQERLGVEPTGVYGATTVRAVWEWQRDLGSILDKTLQINGEAGLATFRVLIGQSLEEFHQSQRSTAAANRGLNQPYEQSVRAAKEQLLQQDLDRLNSLTPAQRDRVLERSAQEYQQRYPDQPAIDVSSPAAVAAALANTEFSVILYSHIIREPREVAIRDAQPRPELSPNAINRPGPSTNVRVPSHTGHPPGQVFDPNDLNQGNNHQLPLPNNTAHGPTEKPAVTHVFELSTYQQNYIDAYGPVPKDHQIHHIVPQAEFRESKLAQEWQIRGLMGVHEAGNLIAFPQNKEAYDQSSIQIQHWGSHPVWNAHVNEVLGEAEQLLKDQYGSLERVPAEVMQQIQEKVMESLREDLLDKDLGRDKGWIQDKKGLDKLSQVPDPRDLNPDQLAALSAPQVLEHPPYTVLLMRERLDGLQAKAPKTPADLAFRVANQLQERQDKRPSVVVEYYQAGFWARITNVRGLFGFDNIVGMSETALDAHGRRREAEHNLEQLDQEIAELKHALPEAHRGIDELVAYGQQPQYRQQKQLEQTLSDPSVQAHLQEAQVLFSGLQNWQQVAETLGRGPEHQAQLMAYGGQLLLGKPVSEEMLTMHSQDMADHQSLLRDQQQAQQYAQRQQPQSRGIELELG
jgi:hypothetical protein